MQHLTGPIARPNRNVCVAAGDRTVRAGISRSLAVTGCRVLSVASAHELLDILVLITDGKAARPDLFVTAASLGDLPDLNIVDELRFEGWAQPIILLTSGEAEGGYLGDRCCGHRKVAPLAAPFDPAALVALVSAMTG